MREQIGYGVLTTRYTAAAAADGTAHQNGHYAITILICNFVALLT